MTYGPVRNANAALHEGLTDGQYKKMSPDRGGFTETATEQRRADLSDVWYGRHEQAVKVSGDTIALATPGFIPTAPANPAAL